MLSNVENLGAHEPLVNVDRLVGHIVLLDTTTSFFITIALLRAIFFFGALRPLRCLSVGCLVSCFLILGLVAIFSVIGVTLVGQRKRGLLQL